MATVRGIATVHYADFYGIKGQSMYNVNVDDTQTLSAIGTTLFALRDVVNPLSQAENVLVTLRLDYAGSGGTPVGDIEKGALFNFNNNTDVYATGELVPDVNPAILNPQGLIDLANTAVVNFVNFIKGTHTGLIVTTKEGNALANLKDALITFRKHRKPLSRKTKEGI